LNISRLLEKKLFKLFLIIIFLPIQSCSNTLIGEKLENSFDITDNLKTPVQITNKPQENNEKTKIKSVIKDENKENDNNLGKIIKINSISNKERLSQKPTKSIKKTIFNPQPYRIILRLSGANPSAPAETVTEALRKAGVQFEVEKIERFDEENSSKNTPLKR